MGFIDYVPCQNNSGQFCPLLLFSLYGGKRCNAHQDYDRTLLCKRIQDRRKVHVQKALK